MTSHNVEPSQSKWPPACVHLDSDGDSNGDYDVDDYTDHYDHGDNGDHDDHGNNGDHDDHENNGDHDA